MWGETVKAYDMGALAGLAISVVVLIVFVLPALLDGSGAALMKADASARRRSSV